MDDRFSGPRHCGHGLGYRAAVVDDVIETGFSAVVLPNGVCSDQPGALHWLQMVVRAPNPVATIVRPPVDIGITLAKRMAVTRLHLPLELVLALIRRIANDGDRKSTRLNSSH